MYLLSSSAPGIFSTFYEMSYLVRQWWEACRHSVSPAYSATLRFFHFKLLESDSLLSARFSRYGSFHSFNTPDLGRHPIFSDHLFLVSVHGSPLFFLRPVCSHPDHDVFQSLFLRGLLTQKGVVYSSIPIHGKLYAALPEPLLILAFTLQSLATHTSTGTSSSTFVQRSLMTSEHPVAAMFLPQSPPSLPYNL